MSGTLYNYINNAGVIVPDTSTLLTDVQTEWTGVFGSGMNLDSSTPQGVIIASEVAARSAVVQNNAALANQINPDQAGGIFLDAICALFGLTRAPNTFTIADNVNLTGVPGSPIAAGSIAKTPNNDQFALQSDVTLDSITGFAQGVTFVAIVAGPIAAPTGVWTIVTSVLGWEGVNNHSIGVPGTNQQTDKNLAALRRNTLALQSTGLIGSILSALSALPNVIGVQGLENQTGGTVVTQGITLTSHSIWVCVDGGVPADIGFALMDRKSIGAAWNGAQSVSVIEPISGNLYNALYDVPTLVPIAVKVTCLSGSFTGNLVTAVTQAVLDFANNLIANVPGLTLGIDVSPFAIAAGIYAECPGILITAVQISPVTPLAYVAAEIAIAINQKATIIGSNVNVVSG